MSRETDSKSGKTAEEEKSAWESFRIDKAVGEAQESDEDASKSRAATPDPHG